MATDSKPTFPDELIDQLLAGYSTPEDLTGKDGILKQLTARLVERALQGELSVHLDEKILALYARGMTVRDIQGHLEDLYGVEVSPDLISRATSAVMEDVIAWQNRPLDAVYPIVYLDALVVKVRDQGVVRNKSVYLALGITVHGTKEVLGIWIEQSEGA